MQAIGVCDYADFIKLLLEESAKVLILLLFAVLGGAPVAQMAKT
jgi:hypothetical protein